MAPPLFWPSCSKVKKNTANRHAVKCLTWRKIVHQIASFKPTFSKKFQLLRGTHPPRHPLRRASATTGADAPFFYFKKYAPHFKNLSAAYDGQWSVLLFTSNSIRGRAKIITEYLAVLVESRIKCETTHTSPDILTEKGLTPWTLKIGLHAWGWPVIFMAKRGGALKFFTVWRGAPTKFPR